MGHYAHAIFATDLSPLSEQFAKEAVEIASAHGAKLSVIHVVEPIHAYAYSFLESVDIQDKIVEEATANLARLCETIKVPESDQKVVVGPTRHEIINTAKELGADLLILGSHGRSGLARLLGSTANGVLNHAECDVLIVRAKEQ